MVVSVSKALNLRHFRLLGVILATRQSTKKAGDRAGLLVKS
ncbi:hypothetical protein [Rhizobium sp. AN80A]|nr:hypothetical protein [Rhizobium sp. AN80A]